MPNSVLNSLLLTAFDLDQEGHHRRAAVTIMEFIETHFKDQNFEAVNELLTNFEPSKWSNPVLSAVVRPTARYKVKLQAWQPAYEKSLQELQTRNKAQLFVGLN